jgi:hypothetical protein
MFERGPVPVGARRDILFEGIRWTVGVSLGSAALALSESAG